jgi:O-antigen ligase
MMMMMALLMVSLFFSYDGLQKKFKLALFILFGLFSTAMVFSGIRGAFLGFFFGTAILLILTRKKRIALSIAAIIILGAYNFNGFKGDLQSIVNFKNNLSNNTRIQLLISGLQYVYHGSDLFFGIGAENSEVTFKNFILSHDETYQKKYSLALQHSRDFHNSYLQILIECGFIFLLAFIAGIALLLFLLYKSLKFADTTQKPMIISAIVVSSGFLLAQLFHSELNSYSSSFFYLVLFGGCQASCHFINEQKSIWSRFERFYPNFTYHYNI